MDQNWNEVVIRKHAPKSGTAVRGDQAVAAADRAGIAVDQVAKYNAGTNKRVVMDTTARKIEDEEEDFTIKKVERSMAQRIQQARAAKKMTQKDLARMINEKPNVVQDYEQGKAMPNHQVINKLERALGAKLRDPKPNKK